MLAQQPEPVAGIESVSLGPGVLFWSVDGQHQKQSTDARLNGHRVARQLTVRNHNTPLKLLELLAEV